MRCRWLNESSSSACVVPSCLYSSSTIAIALLTDALQQAWATLSQERAQGSPPGPPAQLALATILQASTRVSDDEVLAVTAMDRRWHMLLARLDSESAPCSQGTLGAWRQRLIAQQMDRRRLARTVESAAASGACGARQVRAALERSFRCGARGGSKIPRNLLGHALRKAVGVIARQQGRELPAVANEVGAPLVSGASLQAALDLDWDEPPARPQALTHRPGGSQRCGPLVGSPAPTGGGGSGGRGEPGGGAPGAPPRRDSAPRWHTQRCGRGWPQVGA